MLNLVCGDCLQAAIRVLHLLCVIWPWKVDPKGKKTLKNSLQMELALQVPSALRSASPKVGLFQLGQLCRCKLTSFLSSFYLWRLCAALPCPSLTFPGGICSWDWDSMKPACPVPQIQGLFEASRRAFSIISVRDFTSMSFLYV